MNLLNGIKLTNTKTPTEMDRVMAHIAQVENELQQKFFQLGQMYYEDNKDNSNIEEKYYAQVDLINKLSMNRKSFYQNKLRLEGQMMCENCGAIVPYGSMFCNVCGGKTDAKHESSEQAARPVTDTYAEPVAKPVTDTYAEPVAKPVTDAYAEPVAMSNEIRCKKCGTVLDADCVFCVSCGTKVE